MKNQLSRRKFLQHSAASAAALYLPSKAAAASATRTFNLTPQPGRAQLVPDQYGETEVWCFNGKVPGPEIRVRQGDRVRIEVDNQLSEQTTVHWHGLRVPNNMDGVPYLNQAPIEVGQKFIYEFDALDAGTFWYHPHQQSSSQIGRGLYGPLIVDESEPVKVDRDVTWVLDDWRLMQTAQIADDFGHRHDLSHAGRIGNTITVNGKIRELFEVHAGERIRLRLINCANARIFGLSFSGHTPTVIAIDGQPVTPHSQQRIVLGPAMRIDLILDMSANPGEQFEVIDNYYPRNTYGLISLAYSDSRLRSEPLADDIALSANPLAEPDIQQAVKYDVAFEGGAMGGMSGATMDGQWQEIRDMAHQGKFWAINGVAATGHIMDPLISLQRGQSCVMKLQNNTAWPHPIHLHGHSFRVLSRNGQETRHREWQDTVLLESEDQVEVAFVGDNPGDWMFHCHILEHQAAGMMGVIRIV